MNKQILSGKWNTLKGDVKKKWGKLTDDEIKRVEGDYDKLVGLLQKKYGHGMEKTKDEVNDFLKKVRDEK